MEKILKFKKFNENNEGVAGIVVAVLLTGVIISSFAIIQAQHVPKWMEKKEAEHMDEVAKQFTDLKSNIDTLCITEHKSIPFSTSVTLGSDEIPVFSSTRAYGTLEVLPNDCKMYISNSTRTETYFLGAIKFESKNAYYINQNYVYELGSVILSQETGNVMLVRPPIAIDENGLVFNLVKFSQVSGKTGASGYGTYPVQVELKNVDSDFFEDVMSFEIKTKNANSWYLFFNDFASEIPVGGVDVSIFDDGVKVTFMGAEKMDLTLKEFDIEAQIAPGWVS